MTDTAREPIAYLWQHKETGRVYYQGPHDEGCLAAPKDEP